MERAISRLRSRHLANPAFKERNIPKGIGIHPKLHPRISPPLRLLAPGAIDVGIEHAIPQRFPAHPPDLIERRIAAFKCSHILHGRVDLAQANMLDYQRLGQIAKNQCRVPHPLVVK